MTPIFVRTSGRTGSTLLLNLLRSSPEILVRGGYPFEERLLSYFYRLAEIPFSGQPPLAGSQWTHESINLPCSLIGRYPGAAPIASDVHDGQALILRALWEAYLKNIEGGSIQGLKYLAEKANNDVAKINDYVYCKNIFLIRDPRDQLVSIREFDRKRGYKGFGPSSEDGIQSIEYLCDTVKDIFKVASDVQPDEDRRIVIRYEDLVRNRGECLSRISRWLSVSFDLNAFQKENALYKTEHSTSESEQVSIGRWNRFLTEDEISVFHEKLGSYMAKLGYI